MLWIDVEGLAARFLVERETVLNTAKNITARFVNKK